MGRSCSVYFSSLFLLPKQSYARVAAGTSPRWSAFFAACAGAATVTPFGVDGLTYAFKVNEMTFALLICRMALANFRSCSRWSCAC